MVPSGTSPSVNLAASVVFVGGEDDEGVDNEAQVGGSAARCSLIAP